MALENAGTTHIAQAIIGEAVTAFNAANANIGVGNGNDSFDKVDTDLQGASKTRKGMMATFPSRYGTQLSFKSQYTTGEANYAWEEWGVFNGASGNTMLNRYVETLGTKTSAQTWELTVTLTVNNP